jgi:hypothetical protein
MTLKNLFPILASVGLCMASCTEKDEISADLPGTVLFANICEIH